MQGCPLLVFTLKILLDMSARNKSRKRHIGLQTGKKEVKLLLFTDNMIVYSENSKNSTKQLLKQKSEFNKVKGQKVNM